MRSLGSTSPSSFSITTLEMPSVKKKCVNIEIEISGSQQCAGGKGGCSTKDDFAFKVLVKFFGK